MVKINVSPAALNDIVEINKYIVEEFYDIEASNKTFNDIFNQIESLKDFPLLGLKISNLIKMDLNYRYLIIKNFIVFYRYENDEVFILRILNSKRDYLNILLK